MIKRKRKGRIKERISLKKRGSRMGTDTRRTQRGSRSLSNREKKDN